MVPDKARKASMSTLSAMVAEKDSDAPKSFIDSRWFLGIVYATIFLNAAQMGLSADYRHEEGVWQDAFMCLENIFTFVFFAEMMCKLYVLRRSYWADNWNRLDALLVLLSVADCWVLAPIMGSESSSNMQQFSVIRILRVIRLVRMIRFLR